MSARPPSIAEETREKRARIWARDPHDWYVEERRASAGLFGVERFVGKVWDPACGQGNICEEADARGYVVIGTDLVKRVDAKPWWRGERDFLLSNYAPEAENVVCNPPFFRGKGAEAFIRKSLSFARGKVAMFVDQKFLASDGRSNGIYAEFPPSRIWMVTPRVSCPPGEFLASGGKAGGGTADYVWLVWDMTAPRVNMPTFGWIRQESA